MKNLLLLLFFLQTIRVGGQELYVYTEPASNMPAHSLSAKITGHFVTRDRIYTRFTQRYMPELMFGINKKIMLHVYGTLSNMHTQNFKTEAYGVYIKYRFLSLDDVHKHFRMAFFADASHTRIPFHYDEIGLMGDKSGVQLGLIATQLINKTAISATLSHTELLDHSRYDKVLYVPARGYQSIDYSLSAGFLILPKEYKDYGQLNLNLYMEILGQQVTDIHKHYIDMAPALQLIFNSNSKLNLGFRFQVDGNMQRMAGRSWLLSFERTFLNALKKNR